MGWRCYLPRRQQKERLAELIGLVKLVGMENRAIGQLSGGQLQRVALARALAPRPDLLLLDEPFTALEAELREELGQELKALQARLAIPVLLVTHSRLEAMCLAETLILMEAGQAKAIGTPGDLSRDSCVSSMQFSW